MPTVSFCAETIPIIASAIMKSTIINLFIVYLNWLFWIIKESIYSFLKKPEKNLGWWFELKNRQKNIFFP
jgi:hypothetical protein